MHLSGQKDGSNVSYEYDGTMDVAAQEIGNLVGIGLLAGMRSILLLILCGGGLRVVLHPPTREASAIKLWKNDRERRCEWDV